jgi:ADP-heptose:LPS heptosyltransferase
MTISPPPESIAVYVGGDLIGDALMKLPFVRALKGAWPGAHVTWLAGMHKTAFGHELAPLVAGLIDETIEEAGFETASGKILSRPLSGRRFDLVIDTQRGVGRSLLVRRIRHRVFVSGAADFWLSDRKPPKPWKRPPSMIGQMMELLSLAHGSAPRPGLPGPPLPVDPGLEARAAELLPPGPVYIGFAPGAGGQHKRWPLDRFLELANLQPPAGRVPVILLGPGEADFAAAIRRAAPGAIVPEETPGSGHLRSPMLSIAIARRLAGAVANDAGVGHILAAADTPLVSLFGPTPADKFAPAASRLEIVRAQDFGGEDMTAIPEDAVTMAIEKLLG